MDWKVEQVANVVRRTKEQQIREAFRTSGRSNEQGWLSLRPLSIRSRGPGFPLISTGALMRSITCRVEDLSDLSATIVVGTPLKTDTGHNLGRIHQFGIDGPILPVNAKMLFIPLLTPGAKGGKFRAHKHRRISFPPAPGGNIRYFAQYQKSPRRKRMSGAERFVRKALGIRRPKPKSMTMYERLDLGRDFVLSYGIFPSPDKNDQAVPARPFATLIDNEVDEIKENITALFRRRR